MRLPASVGIKPKVVDDHPPGSKSRQTRCLSPMIDGIGRGDAVDETAIVRGRAKPTAGATAASKCLRRSGDRGGAKGGQLADSVSWLRRCTSRMVADIREAGLP